MDTPTIDVASNQARPRHIVRTILLTLAFVVFAAVVLTVYQSTIRERIATYLPVGTVVQFTNSASWRAYTFDGASFSISTSTGPSSVTAGAYRIYEVPVGFATLEGEIPTPVSNTVPPAIHIYVAENGAAPVDLGVGRAPHMRADGSVLVLTPEGLARVEPAAKALVTIFGAPRADFFPGGTISDDGTHAALPTGGEQGVRIVSITDATPQGVETLGFALLGTSTDVAFVQDGFAAISDTQIRLYTLPTSERPRAQLRGSFSIRDAISLPIPNSAQ